MERRINADNYDRPKQTYQDTLQTNEAMMQNLAGYEEIEDAAELEAGNDVRYITYKDIKPKFCLGGTIKRVFPEYVVFSNSRLTWSVQCEYFNQRTGTSLGKTQFFRKITKEIKNEMVIQCQQDEIVKLREEKEALERRLNHLAAASASAPVHKNTKSTNKFF
jgi:hypothetical protein